MRLRESRTAPPLRRVVPVLAAAAAALAGGSPAGAGVVYRDATIESGVRFVHQNGATGEAKYREMNGAGGCALDADGDGRLDLYLVNSAGANVLYRNVGGLRFEDVTAAAGVADEEAYGMGAIAADFDGDGDPDIYVTNRGPNRLFVNRRDGTFEDVAPAAGVDDARFSASACFFDADRDGRLDLYVTNNVDDDPDTLECWGARGTLRIHCYPARYDPVPDVFFRNRGDGTFEDRTEAAGLSGPAWRGLGVVATDYDRDGWPDLLIANDTDPNLCFHNRGDGTFEEVAFLLGFSVNEEGVEEAGMGITAGDYDNDGWMDVFVTNFRAESNTLYHNEQGALFFDQSAVAGMSSQSTQWLGWGTKFFDFDRDGWLDLYVANGHLGPDVYQVEQGGYYAMPDLLHRNRGDGKFELVPEEDAAPIWVRRPGRGAIFADFDDDGDADIVVVNQVEPATVLENVSQDGNAWIGFRTRGAGAAAGGSNRDGVGARVELFAGGLRQVREVRAGEGYLASQDPRSHFGVGRATSVDSVVVEWPSGRRTVVRGPAVGAYHLLAENAE